MSEVVLLLQQFHAIPIVVGCSGISKRKLIDMHVVFKEHFEKGTISLSLSPYPFSMLHNDGSHPCFPTSSLNCQSGGTAIAQLNLSLIVLEKIFSIGTSFRLQKATEIRGSI